MAKQDKSDATSGDDKEAIAVKRKTPFWYKAAIALAASPGAVTGIAYSTVKNSDITDARKARFDALERENNSLTADEWAIAKAVKKAREENLPYEEAIAGYKEAAKTSQQEKTAQYHANLEQAARDTPGYSALAGDELKSMGLGAVTASLLAAAGVVLLRSSSKLRGSYKHNEIVATFDKKEPPSPIKSITFSSNADKVVILFNKPHDCMNFYNGIKFDLERMHPSYDMENDLILREKRDDSGIAPTLSERREELHKVFRRLHHKGHIDDAERKALDATVDDIIQQAQKEKREPATAPAR